MAETDTDDTATELAKQFLALCIDVEGGVVLVAHAMAIASILTVSFTPENAGIACDQFCDYLRADLREALEANRKITQ